MKNRLEMSDAGMRGEKRQYFKNYSVQDQIILRTGPKLDRDRFGPFCGPTVLVRFG